MTARPSEMGSDHVDHMTAKIDRAIRSTSPWESSVEVMLGYERSRSISPTCTAETADLIVAMYREAGWYAFTRYADGCFTLTLRRSRPEE